MDVLKRINKLRLDRGWSIYRLSVEADLSQSTLTNMFNRETLPSITTLECLCRAFGISMSEFFDEAPKSKVTSAEQIRFLELYEALSPSAREAISHLMWELSKK